MTRHFFMISFMASFILPVWPAAAHTTNTDRLQKHAQRQGLPEWSGEAGVASYYGGIFHGRRAANGNRFNQEALTAAHPWLPFGQKIVVRAATTGRTVVVTITDRLPSGHRVVDLSVAAARKLGILHAGIARVTLVPA